MRELIGALAAAALATLPVEAAMAQADAPAANSGGADRFFMQFEGVWLGVFGLGELTFDAFSGPDAYQVSAAIRSGGLAALFDRTALSVSARGPITERGPAWGAYDLDHSYGAKRRVTMMRANAAGGVDALVTPGHRNAGTPPVSPGQRAAARDPLTAILGMGREVGQRRACVGAYPVFDGKLYYILSLSPAGPARRHIQGGYDGMALACRMRLMPMSGYEPDEAKEARGWPAAELWFGLIEGASFAPPVHVRIPFALGDVSLTLKSFRRPEVAIPDGM
jgi:hypothetical protein